MLSAAPSRGPASQPPQGRPPRLLVGAKLAADELAAIAALAEELAAVGTRAEVEIQADVAALARRAVEESVWLVMVDRALPELSSSIMSQITKRWEASAPVVFLSHSQVSRTVTRTLKLWRDLTCHLHEPAERLDDAWWRERVSALALTVSGWREPNIGRHPVGNERRESSSSKPDPMTLLVRPRSAEQERDAKRRTVEAAFRERARLLQGALSTQEVASLLGVTRQTPHDRVKAKTLLAVEDKGALKFPLWQFDADESGGVVKGLPEVLRALTVGDLAKARWLERPNPVFEGRSPLEALKAGELERVVREARGVGAAAGHG